MPLMLLWQRQACALTCSGDLPYLILRRPIQYQTSAARLVVLEDEDDSLRAKHSTLARVGAAESLQHALGKLALRRCNSS